MSVFSPLALTQTLPFLPLAQGDIDYEVARHGQGAIADYANVKMRLAQLPGAYVAAELESHPSALAIFLGSYGGRLGEHVIAVDVTHVQPNDTTITAATARSGGADDAFAEVPAHESQENAKSLLETPAHAKPDRQPPPSRSACGTPGSVTARRAARPSNRRSAAGLSTARTMRMAIVCCSPESSQR